MLPRRTPRKILAARLFPLSKILEELAFARGTYAYKLQNSQKRVEARTLGFAKAAQSPWEFRLRKIVTLGGD